jgi:ABC-type transporter Mla subunit MlaD
MTKSKLTMEQKVDLLIETFAKFIDAAHRHNDAFRDAISNLADVVHANDEQLTATVSKLVTIYISHAKTVEEIVDAIADDVKAFDDNLHTMNTNAEQRFNAMHLEHNLIIDMVSRLHGAGDDSKRQKSGK